MGRVSRLEILPGWGTEFGAWHQLHGCFTWPPGGDRATGYLYSDGEQPWPPGFAYVGGKFLDRLAVLPGVKFTICAFQAYRDGSGCGWHADTPFAEQAILSLGVTRTFQIRPAGGGAVETLQVADGDLLYMPAGFQNAWEHRVPQEDVPGERCSLVFRTKA